MLEAELRKNLELYLARKLTLRQLEEWAVPRLPMLFASPESSVAKLASALELGLAEMGSKAHTEKELRQLLREALAQQVAA